jgi:transposase
MKPLTIINKEINREALLGLAERIEGAWIGIRIAALLLILSGWRSTAVAEIFNLSRPAVIAWIKRANKEGLTAIEDKARSGRPGKFNAKVAKELEEALKKSPEEYGLSRFRWDGIVVVEFLKRKLNISLKPRQARNWLKKLGYVRKRPIHYYVQASEDKVNEFKEGLKKSSENKERI